MNRGISSLDETGFPRLSQSSDASRVSLIISSAARVSKCWEPSLTCPSLETEASGSLHLFLFISGITSSFFFGFLKVLR